MARGLNRLQLIGHLGQDPELKYTPGGAALTTFSVAVDRTWRTPEGDIRAETDWFRVVAWQQLAEICHTYLRKGSKVYVEGPLRTRTWTDPQGQTHSTVEVQAEQMLMLDPAPGPELAVVPVAPTPAAEVPFS